MVQDYIDSINENHYRRNITLGEIKVAQARDSDGTVIYEAVYSQVIDNLVNNKGVSVPKQITWPRPIPQPTGPWITSTLSIFDSYTYYDPIPTITVYTNTNPTLSTVLNVGSTEGIQVYMELTGSNVTNKTDGTPPIVTAVGTNTVTVDTAQLLTPNQLVYFNSPVYTALDNDALAINTLYPASLTNMRLQIIDQLGQINTSGILPLWMTSQQENGAIVGYTPAWVIAYAKPGYGSLIKANIEAKWPYKLNQINFGVDRFEIDLSIVANPPTPTNIDDAYVIFRQKNILPNSTI
jgi:hypothetical protein